MKTYYELEIIYSYNKAISFLQKCHPLSLYMPFIKKIFFHKSIFSFIILFAYTFFVSLFVCFFLSSSISF